MKNKKLHKQCLQALSLLQNNQFHESLQSFLAVLKKDPKHEGALAGVTSSLISMGHAKEALAYIQQALDLKPTNPHIIALAIDVFLKTGDFQNAEFYAKRIYELAPNDPICLDKYILCLMSLNEKDKVESALQSLLNVQQYPSQYNVAGLAYEYLGKSQESIQCYRAALNMLLNQQNAPPPRPKPCFNPQYQKETLLNIKSILDSLNIPFSLAMGTLLGIYRDGDMLPGDSDIDIMLPWGINRSWLINSLKQHGCISELAPQQFSKELWCISIIVPPHDMCVEISFLKPDNGRLLFGFERGNNALLMPLTPFQFTTTTYLNTTFTIPNPIPYLSEIYGAEWNKATKNRNFFIINPNIIDSNHIRITYALNHIVDGIIAGNYKKAHGITEQLLSIYDDPILEQIKQYLLNLPFNIDYYPPIPIQPNRISHTLFK